MQHNVYQRTLDKCWKCGFCKTTVKCPSPDQCIGCQACYFACFREAIKPQPQTPGPPITITVDDQQVLVPSQVTVKEALESVGFYFSRFPKEAKLFAPCQTGGCHACTVIINNERYPSCHTPVQNGQVIQTQLNNKESPRRIVGWYMPHTVGGVGTPYTTKAKGAARHNFIEVACFTAGCNLRCKTCQNFDVTYNSSSPAITPQEAATQLSILRRKTRVNRLAISGGEPTLNRQWLLDFFTTLRQLNPDPEARFHLDTNATILTPKYIDDLITAGITDVGPDLKAKRLSTYQTITGISDSILAKKHLETSWNAVRYLADQYYPESVFVGVGLPFNPAFYPTPKEMIAELHEWGTQIASIDTQLQICILDYRPEFRRRDIKRPSPQSIQQVKELLEGIGLRTVIAQTSIGHLPPKHPPRDLATHKPNK